MLKNWKQGYERWCPWILLNHCDWEMDENAWLPTDVHLFTVCQLARVK